nr:DUF3959 family protein [Bacillus sp. REN10]
MVLSCLFPVAGAMKYMSLELSLLMGGLLFLTSIGSYYAKRWHSRIFSWIAYTGFIAFLLAVWDQYVTIDSLEQNVKIAVCIAVIPGILRFRTYAITVGLLGLWGAVLWDIKEMQSLAVLQRMMNLFQSEPFYLIVLAAGCLLGGWLAGLFRRGKSKEPKEKSSLLAQTKRFKPTLKIPVPSLPKVKVKLLTFGRKRFSRSKKMHTYEPVQQEQAAAVYPDINEQPFEEIEVKQEPIQGQTRMERRKNRLKA